MEQNSGGDNVITGYDLFELNDVKTDGEEEMLKVMGSIQEGVSADA